MTFDPTKPVQTRRGRPARIVCTDRKGAQQILALLDHNGVDDVYSYWSDGTYYGGIQQSILDLINIPERFERQRWVNVYEGSEALYTTRENADRFCLDGRIACIPITISGVVGEGLEAK